MACLLNNMISNDLKMFIKGSYIISLLCKDMIIKYNSIKLYIELIKGTNSSFMNYILQLNIKRCENYYKSLYLYHITTKEMFLNFPILIKEFSESCVKIYKHKSQK